MFSYPAIHVQAAIDVEPAGDSVFAGQLAHAEPFQYWLAEQVVDASTHTPPEMTYPGVVQVQSEIEVEPADEVEPAGQEVHADPFQY